MFIHCRQACEFTSSDGDKFRCPLNFIGIIPAWVEKDEYFRALCSDGKITAHVEVKAAEAAAESAESAPKGAKAKK